jgi:hypothetical protein
VVALLPNAGAPPVPQAPPAGDGAAAAELAGGQQPPGHPGAQLVDDAAQAGAVIDAGRPPLRHGGVADLAYGRGPGPVGYRLLTAAELSAAGA